MTLPRLFLIAALSLTGLGSVVAGKPRIATVDASELFAKYHRTETEKAKLAEEQKKLANDPRTAVIAKTINELRELETQVRNAGNSEDSRDEFYRKYQMKAHELRSLQRDTTQYRQERQKALNKKLVNISKILLSEIQSTVQRIAAAEGFDMVLDLGGDTSSQVPTLIYIRDATDLTARVLTELNRNKPDDLPKGVTPVPITPGPPALVPSPPQPTPPPATSTSTLPTPSTTTPPSTPVVPTPPPPAPTPIPRAVPASEDE